MSIASTEAVIGHGKRPGRDGPRRGYKGPWSLGVALLGVLLLAAGILAPSVAAAPTPQITNSSADRTLSAAGLLPALTSRGASTTGEKTVGPFPDSSSFPDCNPGFFIDVYIDADAQEPIVAEILDNNPPCDNATVTVEKFNAGVKPPNTPDSETRWQDHKTVRVNIQGDSSQPKSFRIRVTWTKPSGGGGEGGGDQGGDDGGTVEEPCIPEAAFTEIDIMRNFVRKAIEKLKDGKLDKKELKKRTKELDGMKIDLLKAHFPTVFGVEFVDLFKPLDEFDQRMVAVRLLLSLSAIKPEDLVGRFKNAKAQLSILEAELEEAPE